MRETVAEFERPVMLYSIGKDFERDAACGAESFRAGQAAVPAAARRHHLEIPRDDRLSRRDRGAARHGARGARQRGRPRARHLAGRLRLDAAHAGDENRSPAPGARPGAFRRRLRRRAPRRGEEPRQGAHVLAPLRQPCLGPAQPAPGAVASVQHPHQAGRVDARLSAVELDRARRLGVYPRRAHPGGAALFRQGAAGGGARRHADHGRRRAAAAGARRKTALPCGSASARSAAIL